MPAIRPNISKFGPSPALTALNSVSDLVAGAAQANREKAALGRLADVAEENSPFVAATIRAQADSISPFDYYYQRTGTVRGGVGGGRGSGGINTGNLFQSIVDDAIDREDDLREFGLRSDLENLSHRNAMARAGVAFANQVNVEAIRQKNEIQIEKLKAQLDKETDPIKIKAIEATIDYQENTGAAQMINAQTNAATAAVELMKARGETVVDAQESAQEFIDAPESRKPYILYNDLGGKIPVDIIDKALKGELPPDEQGNPHPVAVEVKAALDRKMAGASVRSPEPVTNARREAANQEVDTFDYKTMIQRGRSAR